MCEEPRPSRFFWHAPAGITAPGGTDTTATEGTEITAPGGSEVRSEFAPFNGARESTYCPTDSADLERNKANVVGYYTTAFNDHDPERAVETYGGAEHTLHNPLADNGFEAFIGFVNTFAEQYPDLNVEVVRVFAECDFVITRADASLQVLTRPRSPPLQ